ncbi:MAG TPA: Smr/MutS family protein [Pyrinomonadaceae bacterium]|nr:Smr/MutS family protein [Pyrinomonadaceae bacterium]
MLKSVKKTMWMLDHLRRMLFTGPANTVSLPDPDEEVDPDNPFPEPLHVPLTDVLDLHTIPPRDVKRVVEGYLQQAHEAGYHSLRLIHGKGVGVQRDTARTILRRTEFVEGWTDAPPQAGGLGATIVHLRSADSADYSD